MPWKCPACHEPIRHSEVEVRPGFDARYRCHICRLELVLNPQSDKLVVAPLGDDQKDGRNRYPR